MAKFFVFFYTNMKNSNQNLTFVFYVAQLTQNCTIHFNAKLDNL